MQGLEVEDHVRIELHPDTHILLGYFDPVFCGLSMLKTPNVPGNGYRLAMYNDSGTNPLVNPQSRNYVVDLVLQHPLMAGERMDRLLRSHLKSAYDRTCVFARSTGHAVEERFGDNLHLCIRRKASGTTRCRSSDFAPLAHRWRAWSWPL